MQFDELAVARFVLPETIEAIGRFTITWNLFEHNYLNNKGSEKALSELSFSPIDDETMTVLNELIEYFRRSLLDYYRFDQQVFDDHLIIEKFYHSKMTRSSHVLQIKDFLNYENSDLKACLYAICRIRNNLLHGEKDIYSIDGQRNLINTASEILAFLNKEEMLKYYREMQQDY